MKITVYGTPGPQGSKSFRGHSKSGKAIMTESSKLVAPWRQSVTWAAVNAKPHETFCFAGPVMTQMYFTLSKPKSAGKKRRHPDRRPDLDKLLRSTFDAIGSAGIWEDDSRVVQCLALKVYPGEHEYALSSPGAVIIIEGVE